MSSLILKRLSATDISALASMKNVAKCDTWCELQNPVNHRVFERKLRPKPYGRGHVCLGVTHRVSPNPPRVGGGRRMASRASPGVAGLKKEPQVMHCAAIGGGQGLGLECNLVSCSTWQLWARRTLSCSQLETNRCDPRSGGATR